MAALATAIGEVNQVIGGMPAFSKLLADNDVHPAVRKEIRPIDAGRWARHGRNTKGVSFVTRPVMNRF